MAKVTISEAINLSGISRSHFYTKYINKGIISVITEHDKKYIDTSELIRVFGNIQLENQNEQQQTLNKTEDNKIISLLEKQISELKSRESEYIEREQWLKQQIDELRHQQSNLLEDKTIKKRKKFLGVF